MLLREVFEFFIVFFDLFKVDNLLKLKFTILPLKFNIFLDNDRSFNGVLMKIIKFKIDLQLLVYFKEILA